MLKLIRAWMHSSTNCRETPVRISVVTGLGMTGNFVSSLSQSYAPLWDASLTPGTQFSGFTTADIEKNKQVILTRAQNSKNAAAVTMKSLLKAQFAKWRHPLVRPRSRFLGILRKLKASFSS